MKDLSKRYLQIQAGFTLLEILAVTTILAILGTVASTSYVEYKKRANDQYGLVMIDQLLNQQAMHFRQFRTYTTSLVDLGYPSESLQSDLQFFDMSIASCPGKTLGQCVQVSAVPTTIKTSGASFTINSLGTKTVIEAGAP